jgi:hypothetical protein
VDGKALTDERRFCGRRSRVVLAPRGPASSSREAKELRRSDGGKRNGSPRRAPISRKPSRREGRLSLPVPVVFALAQLFFCARAPGAAANPVFPAPSFIGRGETMQSSGEMRRENAKSYQQCSLWPILRDAARQPLLKMRSSPIAHSQTLTVRRHASAVSNHQGRTARPVPTPFEIEPEDLKAIVAEFIAAGHPKQEWPGRARPLQRRLENFSTAGSASARRRDQRTG